MLVGFNFLFGEMVDKSRLWSIVVLDKVNYSCLTCLPDRKIN
jgi:hypothetical protein